MTPVARCSLMSVPAIAGILLPDGSSLTHLTHPQVAGTPIKAVTSQSVSLAAGGTHVAMYALMLALLLIGWSLSNAYGKTVYLFGITLPNLVAADEDLADTLGTWHLNAAWALLALVTVHIVAALVHHLVLRDGLLHRVLPGKHHR